MTQQTEGFYPTNDVKERASGHWIAILSVLAPGLEEALKRAGKHVKCPMPNHGTSAKKFRVFKDVNETGGAICSTACGSWNTGFNLLMAYHGWDFETAKEEVAKVLNMEKVVPRKRSYKPHGSSAKRAPSASANGVTSSALAAAAPPLGEERPPTSANPSNNSERSARNAPAPSEPLQRPAPKTESTRSTSESSAQPVDAVATTPDPGSESDVIPFPGDPHPAEVPVQELVSEPPVESEQAPANMEEAPSSQRKGPVQPVERSSKTTDANPSEKTQKEAPQQSETSASAKPVGERSRRPAKPMPSMPSSKGVKRDPAPKTPEQQSAAVDVPPALQAAYEKNSWLAAAEGRAAEAREREIENQKKLKGRIQELWSEAVPLSSTLTPIAFKYFDFRKIHFRKLNLDDSMRFHPEMPYYDEDGKFIRKMPCLLMAIRSQDFQLVTIHRTYLSSTGKKAKVPKDESAKKMMSVPDDLEVVGGAIRLGQPLEGIIGVAEGMETSGACYAATGIPCWSLVNTALLAGFQPPLDVRGVIIWVDKDRSKAGELAANELAARLDELGIPWVMMIPPMPIAPGKKCIDWNDMLVEQGLYSFPQKSQLFAMFEGRITNWGTQHVG